MTPKEKAKELFGKYATYVVMWAGDVNTSHQNCKQCALLTVDEIIESREEDNRFDDRLYSTSEFYTPHPTYLTYWLEVKQEIEKL
jgi:hypothetical protein